MLLSLATRAGSVTGGIVDMDGEVAAVEAGTTAIESTFAEVTVPGALTREEFVRRS